MKVPVRARGARVPASWGQARRGGGQAAQDRWPGSREQGARGRGHRVQGNDDLLLLASLLLAGDVSRVALAIREGRRPIQRPCARLPIRYKHHVGIRALRHVGAGQIRVRRPGDRVHAFRTAAFPLFGREHDENRLFRLRPTRNEPPRSGVLTVQSVCFRLSRLLFLTISRRHPRTNQVVKVRSCLSRDSLLQRHLGDTL